MPTSRETQLNEIVSLIRRTDPGSLLDIGVGFGKYGFLAREYLELWDGRQVYGEWKRRIDGIEVFEEYITPIHKLVYDHIYIGNAIEIVPTLEVRYDLVLMIDVLEHFDPDEGRFLLEACLHRSRNVLVSVPKKCSAQGAAFGNDFETHRCPWDRKHFQEFRNRFFVRNDASLICYMGEQAHEVFRQMPRALVFGRR